MKKKEIITIGGYVGAGKSTSGKLLAELLGYRHYSTGDFMRREAAARGIDFIDFNKILETTSHESREFNRIIDCQSERISQEENQVVIDTHLGFHFAPNSFRVYLTIDPLLAADRVMKHMRQEEAFASLEEAEEKVMWRANSLRDRFIKLYDVNIRDESLYDLVIDTGIPGNTPEVIVQHIIEVYRAWLGSKK